MTPFDLPEGAVLRGKYRVEKVLGEGGMGTVLLATHLWLDQKVAIKILTEAALAMPHVVERFAREARASAKLKNEHVVRILDVDEAEDGMPFMVMEYLEGSDLAQVIKARGALPVAEAAGYLIQACEGVAEAHTMGIVHRDIKPSNLFLANRGDGTPVLKLLDFGISKSAAREDLALTGTQMALGSPRYMAPEQLRGAKNVGYHVDIWSLGVVFYQMVTGVQPFTGETATEVAARIAADQPVAPSFLKTGIPSGIERAILRCLEKRPEDRFASAHELAEALAPFAPDAAPLSRTRPALAPRPAEGGADIPDDAPTVRNLPDTAEPPQQVSSRHLITASSNASVATPPASPSRTPAIVTSIAVAGLGGLLLGGWLVLRGAPSAAPTPPVAARAPETAVSSPVAAASALDPPAQPAPQPAPSLLVDAARASTPAPSSTHRSHSSKDGLELELK